MIKKASYIVTENVVPYKNLALEEYLTFHTEPEECILYLWQNKHTVVIGKNQNCWKECKVNYLEEDEGYLVRRLSGGGAVFHDLGNLNFTFCVRKENYDVGKQLDVIVKAVGKLGLQAEKTGRNDITIDGRKFSGNAFYESNGFCYHHGTILICVDKEQMSKYLNVSKEKLASKSVDSVKSRVANLEEFCPKVTILAMQEKLIEAFGEVYGCHPEELSNDRLDMIKIQERENFFSSWEWKYGRKIPFTYQMAKRFAWGDIELQLEVNEGRIQEVNIYSDAMEQDWISLIGVRLKGCMYEEAVMTDVVRGLPKMVEHQEQVTEEICGFMRENL